MLWTSIFLSVTNVEYFLTKKVTIQDYMYNKEQLSCLHVRIILYYTYKYPNRTPPPIYEHFSLVKGEKEHEVFEMRIYGRRS